jgi:glycopeptide antibiotics resistance protein
MLRRHPFLGLLTGGYLAFVAWLTLTPGADAGRVTSLARRALEAFHQQGLLESIDIVRLEFLANIAMFVPVGVFLLLLFGSRLWWLALTASVLLTGLIETAQMGIPGRVPDGRDLVANTLGALIGIVIALVLTLPSELRRRRRRRAARAPAPLPVA